MFEFEGDERGRGRVGDGPVGGRGRSHIVDDAIRTQIIEALSVEEGEENVFRRIFDLLARQWAKVE